MLSRRGLVQTAIVMTALSVRTSRAADDVTAPVVRLQTALLAAPSSEDFAARRRRLEPVLADAFDFATMSRVAVGTAWSGFDAAERNALVEAFTAYAAAGYAARFDGGGELAFEVVNTRPGEGGRTWVETQLLRPADAPVRFDYLVASGPAGPAIVNVVVDGTLNELARRRAEFRALLDAGGLANLLATLDREANEADG